MASELSLLIEQQRAINEEAAARKAAEVAAQAAALVDSRSEEALQLEELQQLRREAESLGAPVVTSVSGPDIEPLPVPDAPAEDELVAVEQPSDPTAPAQTDIPVPANAQVDAPVDAEPVEPTGEYVAPAEPAQDPFVI